MDFITYSHRNAQTLFENDERYRDTYFELTEVIQNITDEEIIQEYEAIDRSSKKSISQPINRIIKSNLVPLGWRPESPIFSDPNYHNKYFRLDFAKDEISIEVAFNHQGVISWNLIKPVMASELNHIEKAIQTSAGIIICATNAMQVAGNFDNAVGTFETFVQYLTPMYNILTSPLLIIGLLEPETFHIDHQTRRVVRH